MIFGQISINAMLGYVGTRCMAARSLLCLDRLIIDSGTVKSHLQTSRTNSYNTFEIIKKLNTYIVYFTESIIPNVFA